MNYLIVLVLAMILLVGCTRLPPVAVETGTQSCDPIIIQNTPNESCKPSLPKTYDSTVQPMDHMPERINGMNAIREGTDGRICFMIPDYAYTTVSPTGSMRPTISDDAHIVIVPATKENVNIGEMVIYKSNITGWPQNGGPVLHRIVDKTSEGYILRGDNNDRNDPGIVRFEQIESVVVAIVY